MLPSSLLARRLAASGRCRGKLLTPLAHAPHQLACKARTHSTVQCSTVQALFVSKVQTSALATRAYLTQRTHCVLGFCFFFDRQYCMQDGRAACASLKTTVGGIAAATGSHSMHSIARHSSTIPNTTHTTHLTCPSCSRCPSALCICPAECSEVRVVATFREGALYRLPTEKSKSAENSRSN